MKASDLNAAVRSAEERAKDVATRDRLAANEPLKLFLGAGSATVEIAMAAGWAADVRRDLIAAFDLRIKEHDKTLAALGVETDG